MCAATGELNIKWGAQILNERAGHHFPPQQSTALHHCMIPEQWTRLLSSVSVISTKKLSLQELSQTIYRFHAGKNESDSNYILLLSQNKTYAISKLQIPERIKFNSLLEMGNVLN